MTTLRDSSLHREVGGKEASMTHALLERLGACRDGAKWASQHNTLAEAWAACERPDWMIWLMRRVGALDKPTAVRIAIECAAHVLDVYERRHPGDTRPRAAIESARAWLSAPSEETRRAAAAAAAAAYAAADTAAAYAYHAAAAAADTAAADTADIAADTADIAADTAEIAADTADIAAAYAYHAAAAAAADTAAAATERKWQAAKIREIVGPWRAEWEGRPI